MDQLCKKLWHAEAAVPVVLVIVSTTLSCLTMLALKRLSSCSAWNPCCFMCILKAVVLFLAPLFRVLCFSVLGFFAMLRQPASSTTIEDVLISSKVCVQGTLKLFALSLLAHPLGAVECLMSVPVVISTTILGPISRIERTLAGPPQVVVSECFVSVISSRLFCRCY